MSRSTSAWPKANENRGRTTTDRIFSVWPKKVSLEKPDFMQDIWSLPMLYCSSPLFISSFILWNIAKKGKRIELSELAKSSELFPLQSVLSITIVMSLSCCCITFGQTDHHWITSLFQPSPVTLPGLASICVARNACQPWVMQWERQPPPVVVCFRSL